MKSGESQVLSSIEYAIHNDINQEMNTKIPTNENVANKISFSKMLGRYFKLIINVYQSNLDLVAYFLMIINAIISPGILTLVYPLSVFGYAVIEETRPGSRFWYFILLYTQLLLIFEVVFSLNFWINLFNTQYSDVNTELNRWYIGLNIA